MPGDDSNTIVLLHFNGTDGSTTFTDDASGGSHTWTAVGNAQLDTAIKKYGTAAGLFDGSGDYIYSADDDDWHYLMAKLDWTIDCWVYVSTTETVVICGQQYDTNNCSFFYMEYSGGTSWRLGFGCRTGGVGVDPGETSDTFTVSLDTWHHVAVVRSNKKYYFFFNGTLVITPNTRDYDIPDYGGTYRIGRGSNFTSWDFKGSIDELRISKVARWTANFTPSTEEYSGATIITATGISSDEAFGTAKVNLEIDCDTKGIASDEAFGTLNATLKITFVGIESTEAFGSNQINLKIDLDTAGISSEETFGDTHVFFPILANSITSDEAFGTAKVNQILYGEGFSEEVFGYSQLNHILYVTNGIASDEAFGSPQINQTLHIDGIFEEVFGETHLNHTLYITDGIASDEAFGTARVFFKISPNGIVSDETFGTTKINLTINILSGIASDEAFGLTNVIIKILGSGISSDEAFGLIKLNLILSLNGVISSETFGLAQLNSNIKPSSITSEEAIPFPSLILILYALSIMSKEDFGHYIVTDIPPSVYVYEIMADHSFPLEEGVYEFKPDMEK